MACFLLFIYTPSSVSPEFNNLGGIVNTPQKTIAPQRRRDRKEQQKRCRCLKPIPSTSRNHEIPQINTRFLLFLPFIIPELATDFFYFIFQPGAVG
jgi:hypothetical protein